MERIKLDELRRQLTGELATVESQLADHGVTGDELEFGLGLDEGFADSAPRPSVQSSSGSFVSSTLSVTSFAPL